MATLLVVGLSAPAGAASPTGRWSDVIDWPVLPIHAVLTPAGDVLSFGAAPDTPADGSGGALDYDVWSPRSGVHLTRGNPTDTDVFCAMQVIDPVTDRVMTAGGDATPTEPGITAGVTFYGDGQDLEGGPPMAVARWYPTGTVLPSGDVFVQGGITSRGPKVVAATPELWSATTGWRSLDGATSAEANDDAERRWFYPRAWVSPDGDVFTLTGSRMFRYDPTGDGTVSDAGPYPHPNTFASSTAVMYRPGKVLQVGGGAWSAREDAVDVLGSTRATTIDLDGPVPVLGDAAPLQHGRHWANATVLPDGTVLVTGGSSTNNSDVDAVLAPELWDPETDTWTTLAPAAVPRLYHSVALLLPDATVLVGGGGAPGPQLHPDVEIFTPPYLLDDQGSLRVRPTLSVTAGDSEYGAALSVEVSADTTRFTLVRSGAVTHSFNNGQRFLALASSGSGTARTVMLPDDPRIAPPGSYLLFALAADGTPSIAAHVDLDPLASPPEPPEPPEPDGVDLGGFEEGDDVTPDGTIAYAAGDRFGAWKAKAPVDREAAGLHGGPDAVGHVLDLRRRGAVVRTLRDLTPGAEYELRFLAARHVALPTSGRVRAKVRVGGVSLVWTATNPSDGPFEVQTIRFTAGSDRERVLFKGRASPTTSNGMVIEAPRLVRLG